MLAITRMLESFAYRNSPIAAQEALIAARSTLRNIMREGRAFASFSAHLHESQWWSLRELGDYHSQRLREIVQAAARDVPFYRDKWRGAGLDVEALSLPRDSARMPLLDNSQVRAAGKCMISTKRNWPLFPGSTSGTTGAPLDLYQDLPAISRENAFIWRQLNWAGVRRGERRAWMRGDLIVSASQNKPPFWRMNRAENLLMLSSYHLSESAANAYLDALAEFDPVVIQAYPSSIGFLARSLLDSGTRYGGGALRGIVTSSETLCADSRREIERAFGCRVFDWYGQFERVAAIGTCEQGWFHLLSDYSFVELLPAGDGLFEIVGTGFNNLSMPLIRYRSGDLVRPAPAGWRCACGRPFPLIDEIVGRADDSIKLPDGRSIGRLDHVFKGVEGILEAQIRQDSADQIRILVVPSPSFGDLTRETLLRNARNRLGESIDLEVEPVDSIPRTGNGKVKGVVCTV
ncbi:MAG TPA: phenylacetate--CoA ligase family protein [Burkholderiales bacterium]